MRKATVLWGLIWLLISISLTGCSGTSEQEVTGPVGDELLVYATIYPVYDFATQVCGDKARVVQLVPDGAEPHDWEPSPQDMVNIQKADVIIYNGVGMETWLQKLLNTFKGDGPVLVDCSAGVELLSGDGHADDEALYSNMDPHIWLDPHNASLMVDNILLGLQKADPNNAVYYSDHARQYQEQLKALDNKYAATLDGAAMRKFIVSHAAFGYLAHRYNLEQVAIRGLSPDADPSPARMTEIIQIARQTGVKYVFFESLVSPRVSEVIAREAGTKTLVLNPLGGVTPEERQEGKDYLAVMEENLRNLALALGVK
ncbi:High-affinity zinc uptake system binding-protein ZnuA precursor [Sporotomaculum syntrophicum]|uniref:High-affinity zinc uptake system binding-protein ZnuA n=1 Tax=Sporotomaculum syntrophicum TaxID=182264 RepID=A0A9D3AYM4_9FIRM|nr:metal ABC transporter substrate-binding protein [Sporotomaculum syntrophicum]KAF1085601.1 High-affinity zinc uptake system binding-protein ZnuA precursor [Sporotomaculum syntrophicum]